MTKPIVNDGIVKCEGCGAHGRRRAGDAAPDFWFYLETTNTTPGKRNGNGEVYILWACSEACRDGLWKRGPGHGAIDEVGSARMREKGTR